ncbi:hypothetical protein PLICRDRAFT_47858 [Plicaturopsis crispa FD-325 SS-3]|nr:hypothetical protein PLICRDRAFT_47858 [Plicaturopsis crispa FD-325 SS-3]
MHKAAVPLETVSPNELYDVVCGTASQDYTVMQKSSERLKQMCDMLGTYDGLHAIAAERTVPLAVRTQSIIQFKNVALSHWRVRKYLTDEQKATIRARCMTFLEEEDDTIARYNELIVAKLARQDYPRQWPTLVSDLMATIDTNLRLRYSGQDVDPRVTLRLRRSLKVLDAIIKECASVKMLTGVKVMWQLVDDLHAILYGYYSQMAPAFVPKVTISTIGLPQTFEDVLLAHIVFKCLTKVAVWFWPRWETRERPDCEKLRLWFTELFQSSSTQAQTLTELRINTVAALRESSAPIDPVAARTIDQLTRHIRLFGKFFRRIQQLNVARFVSLPTADQLVMYNWNKVVQATNGPPPLIADSNDAVFPVRFLVQAMVLFKESLAQWSPFRKNGPPNENTLPRDFVEGAVKLLVTRFIPLNPADLEKWMADPEEWVNIEDKDNELWEYELRPCGERVLVTLATQYQEYVVPLLVTTFNQIIAQPTVDLPSIIQKEALYCAIGRCAPRLKEAIKFDEWLAKDLMAEASGTNPNYPIIKRRIAWLIGKWVSDLGSSADNPLVWKVLLHLLQDRSQGTDAVVRLTAAAALGECVNSLGFNADVFAPFLQPAVTELVRILAETDTSDSKRRITQSLNKTIERVGLQIVPFMPTVTQPIPQLWTGASEEGDWSLKSAILDTTMHLVQSAREHSASLCGIVVTLVSDSLTPASTSHLDEEALVLWLAALRSTSTIQGVDGQPGLITLVPKIIELLSTNADLLGKITSIVVSYFILDAPGILQGFAVDLLRAFTTALSGPLTSINVRDLLIALNLLFQLAPSSLWGEPLYISGLFTHILKTVLEDEEMATTLIVEHIQLLARIAMSDGRMFLQLMSATATAQNTSETNLWEGLLDQWWRRFDNISEPRNRKLIAMGIAALVATGRQEVLQRLPTEIFNLWTDVFAEVKEKRELAAEADGSSSPLTRFWDEDEPPASYYAGTEDTPEYDRRKYAYDNDAIRTTQLSTYVAASLREAEASCGSTAFRALYLDKADPTVFKQIQDEIMRS